MPGRRLPFRDPRTVARDIPGVLDILFPRLSGGLVASLNRKAFRFEGVDPIPDTVVESSSLRPSMLFELSVARAERLLSGDGNPDWADFLEVAVRRQSRHFDAVIPKKLFQNDIDIAEWAAQNLVKMLKTIEIQNFPKELNQSPVIPGMGWISSGVGDFSIGKILIEIKHTDRNFVSGDFRQVLIYWMLKYASYLERGEDIWSDCILINPRRNSAILFNFDYLIKSASQGLSRLEIFEQLRFVVGAEAETRF